MAMDYKELLAKQEEIKRLKLEEKNEKESALTKVLTFRIGEQIYGVEISNIVEIIGVPHITSVPGVPYYIKGIINVRSKVMPIISTRIRFGREEIPYDDRTCTIIIGIDDVQVGIIVDSVLDVLDVHKKNIAQSPNQNGVNDNKFIKYLLEMPDGVKLILDVNKLVYENDLHFLDAE